MLLIEDMNFIFRLKNSIAFMLSICIFLLYFPSLVLSIPTFTMLLLPNATGPEALTFDLFGGGPITGAFDGRILKYQGPNTGFTPFGFDASTRSRAQCDNTTNPDLGPICGRPLGLAFNYARNLLYIADAYVGLRVKSSSDTQGAEVATSAEGLPFRFLNGLDVDQQTGIVYFTDYSSVYQLRNITQAMQSGDSTGRLLRYNPGTNQVTVLLRNLSGPTGVAVGGDGSFVLVSESIGQRILKYYLQGSRAGTTEVIVTFQGNPDNIKRNLLGDFWVAVNVQRQGPAPTMVPTGQRITASGTVLQIVNFAAQYNSTLISEVQERLGRLFIGSPTANFVGVYTF